jgi:chemotaxis protein methyltransferase CheR
MTSILSEDILAQLEGFIATHLGLHFPKDQYRNLERGLALAAKELHFADPKSFAEALLTSPVIGDQLDILASCLTIGETYFFRERRMFEILEQHILPEWIYARRATTRCLKIWSAGCCTGEEAYSLAMLIHKMIPDLANWDITILATDINTRFLDKAKAGIYSKWSFRCTPGWVKERYFKKIREGRYEILPYFKEMVKFRRLNLVENRYPSSANLTAGMDLILCRNVLMYFIPWQANKVVDLFYRCLIDGGWMIVGPSEVSCLQLSPFARIDLPEATLHQKRETKSTAPVREQPSEKVQAPELPASDSPPGPEVVELYEEGRYAEVADRLSRWLSQGRPKPETVFPRCEPVVLLVKAYANLGKLDAALTWCDWGIAEDKLNPLLRFLRAIILQEQGQMEEALAPLKQAVYLDPDFVLGHFTLGNVTHKLGRIKESEKHFANTLRLLNRSSSNEIVPESDGMTAGSLLRMIPAEAGKEKKHEGL